MPALAAGGVVAAAAGLGFGPYNFPRAVVFLGDLGSYFMGSWIAVLVVFGLRARVTPEAVLAPVALYLADTGTVLVRRVRRGEPWWRPHRTHAYQRLVGLGWSHPDTTLFVTGVMAVCSGIGLLAIGMPLVTRVALDAGIVLTIAGYLAAPSLVARSRSPRAPAPA